MATLEERIQNLTQQVNPMGSGVVSDQDVEMMVNHGNAKNKPNGRHVGFTNGYVSR